MKKIISITLCICLVFTSFSLVSAADQAVSDAITHTRLQTIITWLQNTAPTYNGQNLINNNILDIKDALIWNSGESTNNIIYYVRNISNGVDAISSSLTSGSGTSIANILNNILTELTWTNAGGTVIHGIQTIMTYISNIRTYTNNIQSYTNTINQNVAAIGAEILSSFPATVQQLTALNTKTQNIYTLENNTLPGIYAYAGSIDGTTNAMNTLQQAQLPKLEDLRLALTNIDPQLSSTYYPTWASMRTNAHMGLLTVSDPNGTGTKRTGEYYIPTVSSFGVIDAQGSTFNWKNGSPIGNIALLLQRSILNNAQIYRYTWISSLNNYSSTQTRTNWKTLASETFTPSSAIDGIYKWFGSIQTPIARLASVHASDEEIQAREYAANNQAAVTSNFINPSGTGSVPTSSFGSLSGISSGVKTNLTTDANPNGIFDVFNSSHGTWFSQEIADSLDTTSSNTRKSKNFDTPLLDERINEIYNSIGGDKK